MDLLRCRASCVLALSLTVAVPAGAQQLPELPVEARIRVSLTPLERERKHGVAYVTRFDADSLHFRFEARDAVTVVPWERVRALKVSEGRHYYSVGHHARNVVAASALGAVIGYATWHSCRDDPEKEGSLECIFTTGRLGDATEGGAILAAGAAVVISLFNLKGERWRDVPTPGAVRLIVRRARDGVGVGVAIAF